MMELNEMHSTHEQAGTSLKVLLLIFSVVLVGVLGYLVWVQNNAPDATDDSSAVIKKTTSTNDTGGTATPPALACGDATKYGFVMTFGNLWTGMKIKEVLQKDMDPQPGYALVTCYFNMPTTSTDTVWTTESVTNFAKYSSLFAVSVYTPAQWADDQTEPNKATELGHNASYYWGWAPAQAYPDDLAKVSADVKTVVATFQLVK